MLLLFVINSNILSLDINECQVHKGGCHVNATCTNLVGSHSCICTTGHTGNGTYCEVTETYGKESMYTQSVTYTRTQTSSATHLISIFVS